MSDDTNFNINDLTAHFLKSSEISSKITQIKQAIIPTDKVFSTSSETSDNHTDQMQACLQVCNKADYPVYKEILPSARPTILSIIEEILLDPNLNALHARIEESVSYNVSLKTTNSLVRGYYECYDSLMGELDCFKRYLTPELETAPQSNDEL
jgi:hypothetical protein